MATPKTHQCDACGGTGVEACPPWCAGHYNEPEPACPVCSGVGSLPDQMPARDAECDAETLRRVTTEIQGWGFGRIFDATYAIDWPGSENGPAGKHAYISAHAAFATCPGLREANQ